MELRKNVMWRLGVVSRAPPKFVNYSNTCSVGSIFFQLMCFKNLIWLKSVLKTIVVAGCFVPIAQILYKFSICKLQFSNFLPEVIIFCLRIVPIIQHFIRFAESSRLHMRAITWLVVWLIGVRCRFRLVVPLILYTETSENIKRLQLQTSQITITNH